MAIDYSGGLPVEREYVFETCPEPGIRDAVNVWLEEENGAFGMRIGVEAAAPRWDEHEIWLDIAFADGRVLSQRQEGKVHAPQGPDGKPTILGAGPLEFRCVAPFRRWTTSFRGEATEITAQNLIDDAIPETAPVRAVQFDIEMEMAAPPWAPGSLLPEAGAILNGGVEGEFMSPRYEQLFRAKGTLTIDGERREFAARGLRIRRQGPRKFEGFWGHCWQSALFPDGRAFGFNIYPPRPDGKPSYAEGFVFDGDGKLVPARPVQVPWLTRLRTSGDDVPLVLETVDGRRVSIDGISFANTRSRGSAILPPDFPIVQQAHVRYRWDGEETVGMMERSSTPDKFTA
jgi:hypothetical protein